MEDLKTKQIPDECSLGICMVAVGLGGFSLCRLCLAAVFLVGVSLVMGMGDAKLFAALTLVFGSTALWLLFLSFLGGAISALLALWEGDLNLRSEMAFAPYIALGVLSIFLANVI